MLRNRRRGERETSGGAEVPQSDRSQDSSLPGHSLKIALYSFYTDTTAEVPQPPGEREKYLGGEKKQELLFHNWVCRTHLGNLD